MSSPVRLDVGLSVDPPAGSPITGCWVDEDPLSFAFKTTGKEIGGAGDALKRLPAAVKGMSSSLGGACDCEACIKGKHEAVFFFIFLGYLWMCFLFRSCFLRLWRRAWGSVGRRGWRPGLPQPSDDECR
jgi:hypothetical protein